MGKNKAYAPTLPRIRYMSCVDLTRRSRCSSNSRCCCRAREHVDPWLLREDLQQNQENWLLLL